MASLKFCIQRLLEAAEFATVGNLRDKVEELLHQLLETWLPEAKDRATLRAWAATELTKLETAPGSGTSELVPTHRLGEISRKMAMLQTVLEVLDGTVGDRPGLTPTTLSR
jgi:hypothetical protein